MSNRFRTRRAPLLGLVLLAPLAASRMPTTPLFDRLSRVTTFVAQAPALIEIGDLEPGTVRGRAFTLDRAQAVRIEAAGADAETARRIAGRRNLIGRLVMRFVRTEHRFEDETWSANAWILNAETREVVWELRATQPERRGTGLVHFEGTVRLPAGSYEAYYAFYPLAWTEAHDGWAWLRGDDAKAYRDLGLRVEASGRSLGAVRPPAEADAATVVSFAQLGDEAHERIGMSVDRAVEVEIRATGEATSSTTYDYGWLVNADTRERVWEFTYEDSEPAGGAEKNRISTTRLRLPAGRYAAFFVTDDSHSPAGWNAPPPWDPAGYGLTIRVVDPADRPALRTFEYEPVPRAQAIVALTGVRDDEYRSQGFTVKRPLGVRIFALGEGSDGDLFDRAWITNATSGAVVWDMDQVHTEHAGGSSKNRLFDGVIRLEPGNYMAHYVSDDSHSTERWNDAPPADRAYWGVTILPASGRLDTNVIAPYDPDADPDIIARIVGVRDNQVSRRRFTMEQDGAVRVRALGEGVGEEMVDYAYIQDAASGERVWEMRYADTEHAGGAEKNRVFDGAIRLRAGDYELVYRTDDSHAFGAWNATPPREVDGWGVRLYRVR